MKAVQITEAGKVQVADIVKPTLGVGEILLRIKYVGFCGSDLNTYLGRNPMVKMPVIPGHEVGAVIEEIGEGVPVGFEKGMNVTVNPYTNCGKCASCRNGRVNACEHNETLGVQRNGSMQEFLVLPWTKVIPAAGLSDKECALIEPMSVGFHAVSRAQVTDIDTVAVIGCGMIGLGAIVRASLRGARVIAMDIDDEKLELAKRLGASMVINSKTENVEVLKWFNDMVKGKDENSYIVAEVWTDRETYAKYLESGIDSVFNFDFGDGDGIIANAVKGSSESGAKGYANVCGKMDELLSQYNENYIDAPFYTNHDMARGAGYYSGEYKAAQIKTAGAMNLMMSGNVFLYYGEEIGMKGSGKDENKRAPMQWSSDASAEGMCKGPDGMESIKMTNGSLEDQQDDPDSIYNYFKQAIRLRNRYPEIARGIAANVENLSDKNIAAITKTYDGKTTLLVFNLSQETQKVDISGVDLGGEGTIGGMLLTGEDTITLDNNELTLPSYSMALITVE